MNLILVDGATYKTAVATDTVQSVDIKSLKVLVDGKFALLSSSVLVTTIDGFVSTGLDTISGNSISVTGGGQSFILDTAQATVICTNPSGATVTRIVTVGNAGQTEVLFD